MLIFHQILLLVKFLALINILHSRLGHSSLSTLQRIPDCKDHDISVLSCEVYVMSKMHRFPFNKSSIKTTTPFQLVHMDLWGPYKVDVVSGAYYFLTLVDDYSR